MLTPAQFAEAHYAEQGRSVELLPFFYCTTFEPGAGPARRMNLISVDRDSDFVWCDVRAVMCADLGGGGAANKLVQMRRAFLDVQITNTGRNVTDFAFGPTSFPGVFIGDLSGWADRPFILFEPMIIPARTAIQAVLTTVDTFTAIDVAFHGMKAVSSPR